MSKGKRVSTQKRKENKERNDLIRATRDERMEYQHTHALEKGYKPDRKTIGKQLKQLLDDEEIMRDDYDAGMRYLNGNLKNWKGNLGGILGKPDKEVADAEDGSEAIQDG